jgi:preprotein translocase subunit SecG
MMTLLYVLHFMVCFVLIGVVLLQRGKGSDLGAALGGGGANTVFGSRGAGNFLTKLTTASAVLFMTTSLSLAYLGTEQADVQLFDPDAVQAEEPTAGGLAPSEDTVPDEGVGGLEEIPLPEAGGLEEVDPAESGGEQP